MTTAREQGGHQCPRCAKWVNDPQAQADHEDWHSRKDDGAAVKQMLDRLPVTSEFTLTPRYMAVPRAYAATYRKNADGTWSQVVAPELPLVLNMDPAHLGFCVGVEAVAKAVA